MWFSLLKGTASYALTQTLSPLPSSPITDASFHSQCLSPSVYDFFTVSCTSSLVSNCRSLESLQVVSYCILHYANLTGRPYGSTCSSKAASFVLFFFFFFFPPVAQDSSQTKQIHTLHFFNSTIFQAFDCCPYSTWWHTWAIPVPSVFKPPYRRCSAYRRHCPQHWSAARALAER